MKIRLFSSIKECFKFIAQYILAIALAFGSYLLVGFALIPVIKELQFIGDASLIMGHLLLFIFFFIAMFFLDSRKKSKRKQYVNCITENMDFYSKKKAMLTHIRGEGTFRFFCYAILNLPFAIYMTYATISDIWPTLFVFYLPQTSITAVFNNAILGYLVNITAFFLFDLLFTALKHYKWTPDNLKKLEN